MHTLHSIPISKNHQNRRQKSRSGVRGINPCCPPPCCCHRPCYCRHRPPWRRPHLAPGPHRHPTGHH